MKLRVGGIYVDSCDNRVEIIEIYKAKVPLFLGEYLDKNFTSKDFWTFNKDGTSFAVYGNSSFDLVSEMKEYVQKKYKRSR